LKILIVTVILTFFSLGDRSIVLSQNSNPNPTIEIILGASNSGLRPPFDPPLMTVTLDNGKVTVTWKNNDNTFHTVTSVSNSFESPPINPGDNWNWTFYSIGNYNYYCSLHPYMTGTIVVQTQ